MAMSDKGALFPTKIIQTGAHWCVMYPLSNRNLEDGLAKRSIAAADHFDALAPYKPHRPKEIRGKSAGT